MKEQIKYNTLFSILQASLFQKEFSVPEEVDWEEVHKEMGVHTIDALAAAWMKPDVVDKAVYNEWAGDVFYEVVRWKRVMEMQNYLLSLLKEEGLDVVIMKGAASGMNYPIPEHRSMGDVDFIASEEQFEAVAELMEANHFILKEKAAHHWEYEYNRVSFELHRYPSGMKADDTYLMNLFQEGVKNLEWKETRGYQFPVFPTLQNGLVFLLHIVHHMENGHSEVGLRQICDWMMYANAHLDDEYYYKEFQPVLKKIGYEELAIHVTHMCQMYLGLRDSITWCKNADEQMCAELLDQVLAAGNFGRKREMSFAEHQQQITAIRIQYYKRHPWEYLKNMQEKGKMEWGLLERYPFLSPFAWAYKLSVSFRNFLEVRKHGSDSMKEASQTDRLFTKLGLMDMSAKK